MSFRPELDTDAPDYTYDSLLAEVLRIHQEPYHYYDDWQVHQFLTTDPVAYIDHISRRLAQIARGCDIELPHKLVFDDGNALSDFRVMPCVIRYPEATIKTVKIVGTNGRQQTVPDQITVGKAFALDSEENYVKAGFAGCILSSARTGACTAAAARMLGSGTESMTIFGAGRVGYYSALYICALGTMRRVTITDLDYRRACNTAEVLRCQFPAVSFEAIPRERVSQTSLTQPQDIVVLATDSDKAIFGHQRKLPKLTISVGADTHWQHEITPDMLHRTHIYVDTSDSLNCGDLKQAASRGQLTDTDVTDLFTLVREGEQHSGRPALFISTGSALFDNLTIDYILNTDGYTAG